MEISNSAANHDVFYAQNDRRVLEPIESSNSDANLVVLHAQNVR